jgi:hypothetical protein
LQIQRYFPLNSHVHEFCHCSFWSNLLHHVFKAWGIVMKQSTRSLWACFVGCRTRTENTENLAFACVRNDFEVTQLISLQNEWSKGCTLNRLWNLDIQTWLKKSR